MGKFFFPALGVGFNELRQIALTLCHRIVSALFAIPMLNINGYNRRFDK